MNFGRLFDTIVYKPNNLEPLVALILLWKLLRPCDAAALKPLPSFVSKPWVPHSKKKIPPLGFYLVCRTSGLRMCIIELFSFKLYSRFPIGLINL